MEEEKKRLTPMKFLPDEREMPWGTLEYKFADLGFIDSLASEGWLKGNPISDIMQTYLERVVGDTSFEWYGTQFPVMVKRLTVKGRTSLHVNPDDENAEQRYDAFGKTALWYVEAAGPQARLYLGFRHPVTATDFYEACLGGSVEQLLHSVKPKPGQFFLIPPGLVHAAQDVTLIEIAECSELWFRLHDWGATKREMHLEEGFDLIDLNARGSLLEPHGDRIAGTPQFTVTRIALDHPVKLSRDADDTFLLYVCIHGKALLQFAGANYSLAQGEVVLVPADVTEFFLLPEEGGTQLLETRLDPRQDDDLVSEPVDEE